MSNQLNQLPKGKKKSPFGKWFLLKLLRLNNFTAGKDRNKGLLLTTVSNHNDYSQVVSKGQNAEECDASKADNSNGAWSIKIFLN